MSIDSYPTNDRWSRPLGRTALDVLRNILSGANNIGEPDTHLTRQTHKLAGTEKASAITRRVRTKRIPPRLDATSDILPGMPEFGEHLLRRTAELEAILHSMPGGVIITNAEGNIVQTNLVAQTWLNQTLSPTDADELQEAVRNLVQQANGRAPNTSSASEKQETTVLELTGLDLELKTAPIAGHVASACNGNTVVMILDVSHFKAIDRKKSRFVSDASHELRSPATTIKLYAALLRQTSPEKEQWARYLDSLVQEADRQAQLVNDILQICRIEAGQTQIRTRPISLNELTETTATNHQALAQKQGVILEHHPAELERMVPVDMARMMQVLNNLVENALHYTPEGGKVTISTGERVMKDRVWATVTVTDTGIGIPADELLRVFDCFFRGERPQLMQISGSGLGLSIVKDIVELHGGRMTVESPAATPGANGEGMGTTFTVWLPFAD